MIKMIKDTTTFNWRFQLLDKSSYMYMYMYKHISMNQHFPLAPAVVGLAYIILINFVNFHRPLAAYRAYKIGTYEYQQTACGNWEHCSEKSGNMGSKIVGNWELGYPPIVVSSIPLLFPIISHSFFAIFLFIMINIWHFGFFIIIRIRMLLVMGLNPTLPYRKVAWVLTDNWTSSFILQDKVIK